jgi:tetratricopeptide (TPR) repeat protein
MRLAEAAMGAEAGDEAVKRYGNILASRPELSHYWVCKATAHSLMGERDAAWDCLCKAIAAKPDDRDAWQARLEYVCEDAREKLQMHIDEYFRHFGLGEGPHLDLAEALLLVSPQDAALADRYIDNVHNANPTNKRAKKLKRQAEKALGKRRWW